MPMALSIRRAAAIPDPPEGGVEHLGDPGGQALLFRLPRESIGMVPGQQTPVGPPGRRRHSSPSRSNRRSTPCGYSRKAARRSAASRVSSMEGTRAKRT